MKVLLAKFKSSGHSMFDLGRCAWKAMPVIVLMFTDADSATRFSFSKMGTQKSIRREQQKFP
jgi:hypothetical protein